MLLDGGLGTPHLRFRPPVKDASCAKLGTTWELLDTDQDDESDGRSEEESNPQVEDYYPGSFEMEYSCIKGGLKGYEPAEQLVEKERVRERRE